MKRTVVKKPNTIKLTALQLSAIRVCRGMLDELKLKRRGAMSEALHYVVWTLLDVAVKLSKQDAKLFVGVMDAIQEIMGMYGDISGDNRAFAVSGIVEGLLYPE